MSSCFQFVFQLLLKAHIMLVAVNWFVCVCSLIFVYLVKMRNWLWYGIKLMRNVCAMSKVVHTALLLE